MASHIAANIASNITVQEPPYSMPLIQALVWPIQSKGGPSIIIDLSAYDMQVRERTFLELRRYIEKSIQGLMKPKTLS